MHVDGSCHCGALRYEAEVDPKRVVVCHCTDCQTISGSPFRTSVLVASGDFKMLAGTPTFYAKTAESGNPRLLAFCPTCGTQLYGTSPGDAPTHYSVRVGTMAQRAELGPVAQVWCRSALGWLDELAGVPRVEAQ